jgi:hypothetical protein
MDICRQSLPKLTLQEEQHSCRCWLHESQQEDAV